MEVRQMLTDRLDYVIGVDSHRDQHALALVASSGVVVGEATITAAQGGYRQALRLAEQQAPGRRVWAVEGSGCYAAGLVRYLLAGGERVLELERPQRAGSRGRLKSDPLDALRAARVVLAGERLAVPRTGGRRESLRALLTTREGTVQAKRQALNQLRALLVLLDEPLRSRLRPLGRLTLLRRCARLRPRRDQAGYGQLLALRACARRVLALEAEAAELAQAIEQLVQQLAPSLLALPGVGPISAAQLLISWSHHGRIGSEAAFARLAGSAPIPASSGKTIRHRLDRGGDRRLNRALHTILLSRRQHDPATIAYLQRRQHDGKTTREAIRCLKRYLARSLYRHLQAIPQPLDNP
jgi:transposase